MDKKFQYKEGEIFYRINGSGKTVVLLHGFAEDGTIWKQQVDFLQQHCRLIVPDFPGSGNSSILQQEQVKIEDFAEVVNAILLQENIAECIVLGHSMGGYITLAFAKMFPAKLLAFGLVHSTAFADSEEKKKTRKKAIKFIQEQGSAAFVKTSTPSLFAEAFRKTHPEVVNEIIDKGSKIRQESLVQYYTAMIERPDRTAVLKASRVPVLFIIGGEDVAAPVDDLLKQVSLPAVSVMHIIKNVGHMSMVEEPTQLNNYLLKFITSELI